MKGYIAKRLLQAIPVLFFVSLAVFFTLHLSGDPVTIMFAGQPGFTEEMVDRAREQLGLNRPLYVQFLSWLGSILRGELGYSYINKVPVLTILLRRVPPTLELAVASMFLTALVAIPGGVLAAVKRGTWVDHLVTTFVTAGIAFPGFWLGIMLVLLFAVTLAWLPSSGYVKFQDDPIGNLRFLILPSVTMAIVLAAPVMRFVRSSMLDILSEEYIRVARSKGLSERTIIYVHALKNALIPTITVMGLQFGTMIGNVILIEWIFGWPGIGALIVHAILQRDYSVVLGSVLLTATAFVMVNLLVDVLYSVIDPRIRYE